ncbi:MAG: imidazole glycerol phosphate synthase subunit HisH [Planctomycetes bacterium]|nr:imidazole glycerol phosphate synthase subunit HisH [Planctomycetota bacterium]MCH9726266.1 imidazole glycerol phosphate synthase subunit HisH [Planctomycetota bacterium]MCH9776654.1 imidazole glycerol phosphate synthase subunit HisH [Planctomycetota bacterium]MCH9793599.1 imidazole glycerol phosphate synthase subunit HisH [Planctomycetota bacterium]
MITIIDYGMGNLRSVQKAFEKIGVEATITSQPDEIARATKLLLPGVGAFRDGIQCLKDKSLVEPIWEHVNSGRPFLGICLGLQLLFDVSYEDGEYEGLGMIPGKVVRLEDQPGLKIPHIGWNEIETVAPHPILAGIPSHEHFYFVHSYYVVPEDESAVVAYTEHGCRFASIVARDNIFASQFHPEKSQSAGLKLLQNFASL